MNKRGLSIVITSLIMVLLVLVAITSVWIVVKNIIKEESDITKIKINMLDEKVDIVSVYINPTNPLYLEISIKKLSGTLILNQSKLDIPPMQVDVVSIADLSGSMHCTKTGNTGLPGPNNGCTFNQSNCELCWGEWMVPINNLINANKELINIIFKDGDESRIGLVGFNTVVQQQRSTNLTNNITKLNNKLDGWVNASGSTCICCGINYASDMLKDLSSSSIQKTMIVMSDGEATVQCPSGGSSFAKTHAIAAACNASLNNQNLVIYTVGMKNTSDKDTLINISKCGNGTYFDVENFSDLISIYNTIAEEIKDNYISMHKISGLRFVFYDNNSNSYIKTIPGSDIPGVLQTKKYSYDLSGYLTGKIKKIEIYPVVLSSKKEEIIGSILDFWGD